MNTADFKQFCRDLKGFSGVMWIDVRVVKCGLQVDQAVWFNDYNRSHSYTNATPNEEQHFAVFPQSCFIKSFLVILGDHGSTYSHCY